MASLSIMIKPASSKCNLSCEYCFYRDEASNRSVADCGIMNTQTFDVLINKALEFADGDMISLTFQGGEPLLAGKEFFNYVFSKTCKLPNISASIQTNATLIDDEFAKMFSVNNVLVGVSLDGNKRANRYRVLASNVNSFDTIIDGINILKKHKVDFNALIVATPWTAQNIQEIYTFFKRNNIKYLQFIPCLATLLGKSDFAMSAKQYGEMLDELFQLYRQDFLKGEYVSIRYFDNLINLVRTGRLEQCGLGGVCNRQYVIEASGDVYPCDFYCLDQYLLGNIVNGNFDDFQLKGQVFLNERAPISAECKTCAYFKLCKGGGCKREKMSQDYCGAYKYFFERNWDKIINFGR